MVQRERLHIAFLIVSVCTLSCAENVAADNRSGAASTTAGELSVKGSVEQIHIAHATPKTKVTVEGPENFRVTAATDDHGALVLRNIPPGKGYRVTFDSDRDPVSVHVLRRDEHPDANFYAAQKLEPTRGYITTRDGTLLSYRVVLPDSKVHGPGPYDLLITYSGYQPSLETPDGHQNRPFEQFSELGYAVAGVNMRGSGCSGGAFSLMEPITWLDGYDMVEAFAAQPWVDDVALGDQSWPGLTQLYVAATQPPSLDAIVAGSVVGDFYRDVFYPGGIENIGFGRIWAGGRDIENAFPSTRKEIKSRVASDPICAANQALRSQNVNTVRTIHAHPYDDDYWQTRLAESLVEKINVPILQIVSWQDPQVSGRAAILHERYSAQVPARLVGINGFHQYWFGDTWKEIVEFLDVYLSEDNEAQRKEYEARNRFTALLESDGKGNARGRFTLPDFAAAGDGRRFSLGTDLKPDDADAAGTFTYDPMPAGSWTKPVQEQASFTSEVLNETTVMAGSGSADLWIAADAEDVDLQVTISEVRSDGLEMLVQSGWLRASHRALDETGSKTIRPRHLHTAESIRKLRPGELTHVRIEIFPFAHAFRKGSQIRMTISGPGGAGNAWPWAFQTVPGKFQVRIAHDHAEHQSSVVLPVVHPTDLDLPDSLPPHDGVVLQPCRPVNL